MIRDNWIYDNADRGIQLYPDSQGTQVYGNVIDGNGEGIIISSDGSSSPSSNNLVFNNVISNSKIRWNVESAVPGGLVGTGNVVRDNCLLAVQPGSLLRPGGRPDRPLWWRAARLCRLRQPDRQPALRRPRGRRTAAARSSPCAALQRR